MKKKGTPSAKTRAMSSMQHLRGTIRVSSAVKQGIHHRTFYELRNDGSLEQISRGIYRLADRTSIPNPDLITIASRVPHAVFCLISALSFHGITTQISRKVSIAIKKDSRIPKIDWPPISVHKFSSNSFSIGIEKHRIDDVIVQIYNVEKTWADCFKFRNKIGMDVVLEALKYYKERKISAASVIESSLLSIRTS